MKRLGRAGGAIRCGVAIAGLLWACGGGGGARDSGFDSPSDAAEAAADDSLAAPDPAAESLDAVTPADRLDLQDPGDTPFVCESNEDCEGHPVGPCQKPVCNLSTGQCGAEWDKTCALDAVLLEEGFESGFPANWTQEDNLPDDFVKWDLSDYRSAFGNFSLYLGNPKCHTYYNGTLDVACKPVEGGTAASLVRVSVTTAPIEIPPTLGAKVLTFYLWLDTEPNIPGIPEQPDQFRVFAISEEGDSTEVYNSAEWGKTTNGLFTFVAANLNQFTGHKIRLRFKFDTLDGNNNLFEGVYLDDVRVVSIGTPKTCQEGSSCGDDGNVCSDDACQVFANGAPNGYCAHPAIPTCVKPECTAATVADDCKHAGECEVPSCVEGHCVYQTDPHCCQRNTLFQANFDDKSLQGFQVYSYQGQAKVKWQVSQNRSTSGQYALYYGDTVAKTYDTPGTFNFGEATSPAIAIPADGWVFLTFELFLSTEFDDTVPELYYNPLSIDFFEVLVIENLGNPSTQKKTQVWSSHNVLGTTGGQFLPVGVDLSDFAGRTVWLQFRFDTSDDADNQHEGVYLDDIEVTWSTATPECPPRRNCMGPYDCGIDGVCRTGECKDSVCNTTDIGQPPDCCATQNDCDDGDQCTTDGCVNHQCAHDTIEGPGCCFEETVQTFDFDAVPLAGFQVVDDGSDVKWQNTTEKVHSVPNALYFGNGTNFDNGAVPAGSALSPAVALPQLPPEGKLYLSFYLYLDVETNPLHDQFSVEVVSGADFSVSETVFSKDAVPESAYQKWFVADAIELSKFKGQTVKIRFRFDAKDDKINGGFGVVVDDVTIRKVCLVAP